MTPSHPKNGNAGPPRLECRAGRFRVLLWGVGGLFASLCLAAAVYWVWFTHRKLPAPLQETLFPGITYRREVRQRPRPLIIHVVTVDLTAPNISFLVTPGDPDAEYPNSYPLRAQTTSHFRETYHAQVAVNGDYFFPFHSYSIFSYYPHVGDPVDVEGVSASRGVLYGEKNATKQKFPTLYISRTNRARFHRPDGAVYNAISGLVMLLHKGRNVAPQSTNEKPEPCTAVALDESRTHLLILMTDGRQPNYSEGTTLVEFADLIREFGGSEAMDLDGGGSEALVAEGKDGKTRVLNEPMDGYIPGRERAVANHLGIFATAPQ